MKKTGMVFTGLAAFILIGTIGFFFRPVCLPLTQENLSSFNVPLKDRLKARDFYLKVWQQKGGQWYQCKTHLSRLMF
jgi:hypothetical protein